jgi:hypothetical protein
MRKLVIIKNSRRPFPYFEFFLFFIKQNKSFSITKHFKFTDSAIYQFNDADQYDINKLFGFSVGMHHNNSFRFGWRPNKDLNKIEIVGYEYHDKVRIPSIPICEVELNKWYEYKMIYLCGFKTIHYHVSDGSKTIIAGGNKIELKHKINWGYRLGLYFGGNKKAPHNITVYQD